FRVELAEVESALLGCDGVSAAACAVREDRPGLPQLVAYLVPRNGKVSESHLRARLRGSLPDYMIPSRFETLRELPRLASGKLDRASLAASRPAQAPAPDRGAGGRTPTERAIAKVWESLFDRPRVAGDDDFFLDLGGHSLLAARAVSELRSDPRFARVSMIDLYRHRT